MCPTRASCSFPIVFQCPSHRLLSALVAAGTCWKAACVSLFLSSPTLYFVRVLLTLVNLSRRSLSVVIRRWWSEDTSAPFITRTSRHDLLNFRIMHMWSIWFSATWFGDIYVALWMRLCGKMLPPVTSWRRAHRSAKRSPFSFICPSPMCPHDVLAARVVHSDLGVEISHQYGYVLCSSSNTACS